MTYFENMRFLFKLLKVKNCQNKHWCDDIGWVMVEVLHSIVMQVMKLALVKANMLHCLVMNLLQLTISLGFQSMHIPFKIRQRTLCCYP